MTTKIEALHWIDHGYDITPIRVSYDARQMTSKSPILAYANDKINRNWILSKWQKNYEIGLVLSGRDYVVFDFDAMSVYETFKLNYPVIETGIVEQSISKRGVHVFFLNTEEITQAIGIIEGLDIKASRNNFVVVNPETDLTDVPELPENLWTFYERNKHNNDQVKPVSSANADVNIPELAMITNGFGQPGVRNQNMSLFVWTLLTLGFNREQTLAVCMLANQNSQLDAKEITTTIEAAWRKWNR